MKSVEKPVVLLNLKSGISGDLLLGGLYGLFVENFKKEGDEEKANDFATALNEILDGKEELRFTQKKHKISCLFVPNEEPISNEELDAFSTKPQKEGAPAEQDRPKQQVAERPQKKQFHIKASELKKQIKELPLGEEDIKRMLKIYTGLIAAEAVVHGESVRSVHLHEVGRRAAVVQICAIAIVFRLLGCPQIYFNGLFEGDAQVRCAHGLLETPVPVVKEMAEKAGLPIEKKYSIKNEMITPTGLAALLGLGAKLLPDHGSAAAKKIHTSPRRAVALAIGSRRIGEGLFAEMY